MQAETPFKIEHSTLPMPQGKPVLLFDGVCNLCNGFVQFVIRHDPQAKFRFAALQSAVGQHLLEEAHLPTKELSTVVLWDSGKFYTHSDVPLRVVQHLGGFWQWLSVFKIVPKTLRDLLYNWIAHNRYRWFGKRESCMVPTPDLKARFLS